MFIMLMYRSEKILLVIINNSIVIKILVNILF